MSKRLVSLSSGQTGFSPFIDVAINGMAAMFVFLAIYVAVVPPNPVPKLKILTTRLPEAVWYDPYETGFVVSGGVGGYTYKLRPLDELESFYLSFDPDSGRISGTPRPTLEINRYATRSIELEITVTDNSRQRVSTTLPFKIIPGKIDYDPNEQKLCFVEKGEIVLEAYIGRSFHYGISILGGIEPYEFKASGLPKSLTISDDGVISGIPNESSVPVNENFTDYSIQVDVVDQQSALLPSEVVRNPHIVTQLQLRVYRIPPIELDSFLPIARNGVPYQGVVVARGGRGRHTFSSNNLPEGLILNPQTGWIKGTLEVILINRRPVEKTFSVTVDDIDPDTESAVADFTITVLPRMSFIYVPE